jgi:phage-related protein
VKKTITVKFFRTSNGKEPVRDWLKKQSIDDKKAIGEDIKAVEFLWPIGYPRVEKLDHDLWEVRTKLSNKICRVFFTVYKNYMILVHSIIKKTQKTPKEDLDLAKKRRNIVFQGGIYNE